MQGSPLFAVLCLSLLGCDAAQHHESDAASDILDARVDAPVYPWLDAQVDGGTDAANVAHRDIDALLACEGPRPCAAEESFAQIAEVSLNVHPGTRCLMTALRDRVPGVYIHRTDSTNAGGSLSGYHVLIVDADGGATFAESTSRSGFGAGPTSSSGPSKHCVLKPRAYFEQCVTDFDGYVGGEGRYGELEWAVRDCVYNNAWFERCEVTAPECPGDFDVDVDASEIDGGHMHDGGPG